MAENENGQEKTEEPSQKRLQDAREKGNVPRSRELATVAVFGAGVASLLAMGGSVTVQAKDWMRSALSPDIALLESPQDMFGYTGDLLLGFLWILAPLMLATLLACFIAPAVMGGFNFATKGLVPDLKKLDPMAGLKRIYGPEGLAELLKSILRVLLVGAAAGLFLWPAMPRLRAMLHQPLEQAAAGGVKFALWLLMTTAAALLLVALFDAPYQKWNWRRKLMMTRQELREEMKESEGRPEVKGRIRQLQHEMSQRRMMEDLPTADVVVVNPTHYAVALKYDGDAMRAPRVIAKGVDEMALRIREVAGQHRITLVEAPPLARVLYREADIGQEIPVKLYAAVAQVLSYVYQLRSWRAGTPQPQLAALEVDEGDAGGRR
ncbi:flagellar biosynthesis protein FlhB [Luteimonas sp BLCC-B24]|uniref:flagellar biosynthesis protein FlhB n=1 Tax=Luteimonas sp. BLCC-B24 TaxID=3025317 RepID=UPI00234DF6CF|nr:flagellar biosynthesis protein FlhB [Luteimonas sp. BLCC-B24]MDC7807303.1 flagellar biosynthesis protein FlhB [Luteimonas sp. BLCC-B24]